MVAVKCGCGKVLRADDLRRLAGLADKHVRRMHPALVGTLSPLELAGRRRPYRAAA
jgi:hypothetical protein